MSLSRVDGPGDAELIAAVRGGDVDAYGELFARHVDAARRLARQLAGPGDADDLVSDAFTKVLTVLQRGGGPDLAFRAYLLTAVRRLHVDRIRSGSRLRPVDDLTPFDPGVPFHDTAVEGFDNATAAKAFASLPERWQMVLWHTEVEQQKPADIAVLLGMSANSVSALAYRAREGLRQAFLSMHAADPDDIDCGWTRDHLGAYVRGGLSRRDVARVDDHLEDCRTCAAVYLELTEVNSGLSALLAPLLLGAAGAKYASSIGGGAAAGGAGTSGFAAVQAWAAAHAGLTIIGGFAVAATAVLAVYGANHLQGHGAADVGSGALSGVPSASSGQSPDGNAPGSTSSRGTDGTGQPGDTSSSQGATDTASPGADASLTPSTDPTSGSTDTTTSSTDPTTNQTDPTTSPTDPTTAPTDPGDDPITFTSVPPIDPVFGSTYQVKATSTSGRAVTFSVDGTPATACAITGDLVSFDHAGTCVISARPTARNAARVGVAARPTSKVFSQTVVIPRAKQTIDFRIGKGAQVDGKLALTASGGPSGKDVTFTSDTPGVCSVNAAGNAVVFRHALQCTVTAHQDGNEDYRPAQDVSDRVDVAKGDQTIDFTQVTAGKVGTDAPLTATSSAGLTVHFATTDAACTVAGSTVTFVHASPCSVTARAGNADYNDATATQQVDVAKGDQTIDFTQVTAGKVGTDAPLTATSSAGLDITFDATSDACTVAGSTVTFVHASPCSVTAKAGNADYNDTTATQQVDVAKGDQTIDFTLTSDRAVVNGTGTLAVTAQGDSGNPVNFTSSTPGACTVTGSTVTFDHAQACSVEATQPESDDYNAASAVTHTLQVGKADQQVAFTSTPPPDPTLHGLYTVSAIGGDSGNPVTFTSTTPDICTVTGTTVALDHAGTCTVAADQAGDDDYLAAPTVTRDITINKASQAISFTLPTAPALGSSHDLVATGGGSGNTVTFTTTTPDQCSVTGSTVTFDHAGICVIAADQAGNDDYEAAPAVIQSVGVAKAAQSITFTSQAPADPAFGGTYVVRATGGDSGNPVTFSIAPATTNNACTVAGSTVTFRHAGTCVIAADQAGNNDYEPATAHQTVSVHKATQKITITSNAPTPGYVGTTYAVSATGGDSGNPVVFRSATPKVCTVSGSTVTFGGTGTCSISADQAGTPDYDAAPTVTQNVNVVVRDADLAVTAAKGADIGGLSGVTASVTGLPADATATLTASASGSAAFRPEGVAANACTRQTATRYTCTVKAGQTGFTYAVNTENSRDVTFAVEPDPPLTDSHRGNNTFVVHWHA